MQTVSGHVYNIAEQQAIVTKALAKVPGGQLGNSRIAERGTQNADSTYFSVVGCIRQPSTVLLKGQRPDPEGGLAFSQSRAEPEGGLAFSQSHAERDST
ncbi:hypothetical protein D3C80_1769930 [compost metagenome]